MKQKRNWIPCNHCGKSHTNTASSSTCAPCNWIYHKEKVALQAERDAEEGERRNHSYTTSEALSALIDVLLDNSCLPDGVLEELRDISDRHDENLQRY